MADTLTTIQYSLERQESALVDLTQKFYKEPIAGMMRDGNGITTLSETGRGLIRYFNDLLYPGGGWGYVSAGGDYPAAQAESEIQPYIRLRHYAMTLGYTEEALITLENAPRNKVFQQLRSKIRGAVDHHQRRIARSCMGRGDGIVARAEGAGSSATVVTSSIPLKLVVGDVVYARNDSSGDGRVLTRTVEVNGVRVTDVDPVNFKFTLADTSTWTDDSVWYLVGAANNASGAGVYPHGIEAMLDNPVGDLFGWDADDNTTYDHVDTYLALTRSTTTQANCQLYNVADSPNLSNMANMLALALARGADPDKMFWLGNATVWQAFADTLTGLAPRNVRIKLPGGYYWVPTVDGVGQAPIRAILDWGMPSNLMGFVDQSRMFRMTARGGWNKRTGSMWKQNAVATAGPFAAAVTAAFDTWFGLAMNLPDTSVLGYGVTTT